MTEPGDTGMEVPEGLADAGGVVACEFPCAGCSALAARVTLLPPGFPVRHGPLPGDGEGIEFALAGWSILVAGLFTVHSLVDDALVGPLGRAMARRDAASLFELVPSNLSPYCPRCPGWYCADHWRLETFFDEGFYDYTLGTCPRDHRRMVDD